jgi:hypothetical protein
MLVSRAARPHLGAVQLVAEQQAAHFSARLPMPSALVRPISASGSAQAVAGSRFASTAAGPDKAKEQASTAAAEEEKPASEEEKARENEEEGDEDAKYEQTDAMPWWQVALWLGGLGLAVWFGSYTFRELVPTATAPQSIRSRAVSTLEGSPEVVERFGRVTRSYGAGYAGERGRRNFVQSYDYERGGRKFTRVKFMVETEEKRRATVFAEVAHDRPQEWHYLMLQKESRSGRSPTRSDVMVLYDVRKPVKPLAVRQRDVVSRLLSSGAKLYHGGATDSYGKQQIQRLGSALSDSVRGSLLVDCSRDENQSRCEEIEYGKGQSPVWKIRGAGGVDIVKRQKVFDVGDLEDLLGIAE